MSAELDSSLTPRAANSDTPIIALPSAPSAAPAAPKSSALSWRLMVVGGWALFIGGFAFGQPDDEAARHWWVDGAWTITYLATTLFSLWAAITLKGRDRMAWSFFAVASGAWFIAQLIWDYYELLADISTPFPALSDLFYLLFAPLYAVGLMFFGEKPKGASIGPKLVSQLVMIGAAVYVAVGLHVSEAIVRKRQLGADSDGFHTAAEMRGERDSLFNHRLRKRIGVGDQGQEDVLIGAHG